MEAATEYEVLVDDFAHIVLPPPPPDLEADPPERSSLRRLMLVRLTPDRSYSAQARAFMESATSLWSPVIYFTTERTNFAEASQYEYPAAVARTYNASGWLPDGADLVHGSGEAVRKQRRHPHHGLPVLRRQPRHRIRELAGVQVLTAQVSITRYSSYSDPRMVMSHWLLHDMAAIPAGAPTFVAPAMGVDSGQVALAQQAWMSIPNRVDRRDHRRER